LLDKTEVAKHNSINDCWLIIDNIVYDVSDYLQCHPAGGISIYNYSFSLKKLQFYLLLLLLPILILAKYLLEYAGKDATHAFREFGHSPFASA